MIVLPELVPLLRSDSGFVGRAPIVLAVGVARHLATVHEAVGEVLGLGMRIAVLISVVALAGRRRVGVLLAVLALAAGRRVLLLFSGRNVDAGVEAEGRGRGGGSRRSTGRIGTFGVLRVFGGGLLERREVRNTVVARFYRGVGGLSSLSSLRSMSGLSGLMNSLSRVGGVGSLGLMSGMGSLERGVEDVGLGIGLHWRHVGSRSALRSASFGGMLRGALSLSGSARSTSSRHARFGHVGGV